LKNRHAIPKYILKRKKDEREKPLLFESRENLWTLLELDCNQRIG